MTGRLLVPEGSPAPQEPRKGAGWVAEVRGARERGRLGTETGGLEAAPDPWLSSPPCLVGFGPCTHLPRSPMCAGDKANLSHPAVSKEGS